MNNGNIPGAHEKRTINYSTQKAHSALSLSKGANLLLPLANQRELIGLLILGPHLNGEAYTREERTMLEALAPQLAPALRVAQMVQEQQIQERFCKELQKQPACSLLPLPHRQSQISLLFRKRYNSL